MKEMKPSVQLSVGWFTSRLFELLCKLRTDLEAECDVECELLLEVV
jgi:hypothetical protein